MGLKELRQKHAGLCDQQQAIVTKAVSEGRPMTAEEKTQFGDLQKQIDGLNETIKAAEAVEARARELDQPANPLLRPEDGIDPMVIDSTNRQKAKLDDAGFKNVGEFLHAVKNGDPKGRMKNLSTSDAGVLIPPAFSQNILRLAPEDEIVMPRANFIPAGDPPDAPFTIPYFAQGANGANGGIALTWTAEAKTVADAGDPKIEDLTLTPKEVSGLATINNKTLANWVAAGDFVEGVLRQAFTSGRDYKFLRGTGVGCPLGTLKAPGAKKIARKTAGTITFEDAAKMMGALLPEAQNGAVWVASITDLPTIVQMADGASRLIYVAGDATKGIPSTLLGLPVIWNGKQPVIGTEGDLMLVNFKYYLVKPGSGPFVAISEHVKFTTNQTVFKIVANIDGQPWVKDPLKLEDGVTTVSPYVILK
jgi:HK97 family phage major capsid protein